MQSKTAVAELKQIISEPPTETDIATFKRLFSIVKGDINATKVLFLSARLTAVTVDSQAQVRAYREMHVRTQATVKSLADCISREMENRFTKDSSKTDGSDGAAKINTKGFSETTASKVHHDMLTEIGADNTLSPVRSSDITQPPASPIKLAPEARSESPRAHQFPCEASRSRSRSSQRRGKRSRSPHGS